MVGLNNSFLIVFFEFTWVTHLKLNKIIKKNIIKKINFNFLQLNEKFSINVQNQF